MATLAFKGHPTRGDEIINILKDFGGKNILLTGHIGTDIVDQRVYFIDNDNICWDYFGCLKNDGRASEMKIFTLEEFEEKYPYKVGDKVSIPVYESEVYITKMEWNGFEIMYCVNTCYGDEWFTSQDLKDFNEEDLEPYKEQEKHGRKQRLKTIRHSNY